MEANQLDQFLTQTKAAKLLQVNIQTLRKYRRQGFFNPIELPRLVLYPIVELEAFRDKYDVRQGKQIRRKN